MSVTAAIVFDLWGTLVPNLPASKMTRMLREIIEILGAPAGEFQRRWRDEGWRLRATGVYRSGADCAKGICGDLGISCDVGDLEGVDKLYQEFITSHLVPCPGVVDSLTRWKSDGVALGMASDCTGETERAWPHTSLAGLVERPAFSSQLGIKKPDPEIFRQACERIGVGPGDCLYLADGAGGELRAAAGVGLRVVQILWPGEEEATGQHLRRAAWDGPRIEAIEQVVDFL